MHECRARQNRRHSLRNIPHIIALDTNIMKIPLTNPATGLLTDELEHRAISQKKLADACKVSPSIISDILSERRRISSEMALRFEITLGIEAAFILRLQQTYELQKFKSEQAPQLAHDLQPI